MNRPFRKIPWLLLLLPLVLLVIPHQAHADWWSLSDVAFTAVGKLMFGIAYVVSIIMGVAIAILAWAMGIILRLNTEITSSPPVVYGFPVALSLANLAFVLSIIVIAVMTILRNQSYGVKQALVKLVVMAILVNFGLIIAGAILQFFDSLTMYFLQAITPSTGGVSGFHSFADAMAGAFNPQRGLILENVAPGNISGSFGSMTGKDLGSLITPIASLVFTGFMLLMIVITLAAIVVMLVIRYVYIGYLLIILPMAWAGWIFPMTKQYWTKWWHNFMKQAFFPVIVIFFLWLAIITSEAMSNGVFKTYSDGAVGVNSNSGAGTALIAFFTGLFLPVIYTMMNQAIIIGIAMGGLITANSMSVSGSKAFYSAAQGSVSKFGSWAKAKSTRLTADKLRTAGTETKEGKTTTALQRLGSRVSRIRGVPGAATAGIAFSNAMAVTPESRKKYIEDYRKSLEAMTDESVLSMAKRRNADESQIAAMTEEVARRKLTNRLVESYKANPADTKGEKEGENKLRDMIGVTVKMGNASRVFANRPDLARSQQIKDPTDPTGKKYIEEPKLDAISRVTRAIKVGEATNVDHMALGYWKEESKAITPEQAQVVLNLTNGHLGKIGAEGSEEQQAAVRNSWKQILDAYTSATPRDAEGNVKMTIGGETMTLSKQQQEEIDRKNKFLEENPNWLLKT